MTCMTLYDMYYRYHKYYIYDMHYIYCMYYTYRMYYMYNTYLIRIQHYLLLLFLRSMHNLRDVVDDKGKRSEVLPAAVKAVDKVLQGSSSVSPLAVDVITSSLIPNWEEFGSMSYRGILFEREGKDLSVYTLLLNDVTCCVSM